MTTVFDFRYDYDASEIVLFRSLMISSAVAFIAGLIWLIVVLTKKKPQRLHRVYFKGVLCLLILGLMGLLISTPVVLFDKMEADEFINAYEHNRGEVVEGVVHVTHKQPELGHDKGDIICVEGTQFEINYFAATRAYKQTIAHGGVLKDGTYVKLYHYDGKILRIDVAGNN